MAPIVRLARSELPRMRRAGAAAAGTLARALAAVRPGMTTADLDRIVREDTAARGARPSQLGYHGFPAAVCTSPNDVACHGIPSPRVVLQEGDLLSVDVTSELDGYHGDTCATVVVGRSAPPGEPTRRLLAAARAARDAGIAEVRAGARLGDIGAACQEVARRACCQVVVAVGGHGIGRAMHLPPHVHHTGRRGRGLRLRAGMAITVEPILALGDPELLEDPDGWTLRTADGSLTAQFEHTVLVTEDGHEILTAGCGMETTDVSIDPHPR